MSDLEDFFHQLVANLAAADPRRLHQPLQVAEILRDILPYRANRRALGLESAEDYEVLLLRLCAGDGGFARTDPAELQAKFRSELAGTNPDLSLLRTHGDALVSLAGAAVARSLEADPHAAYAPPPSASAPVPEETPAAAWEHTRSPSPTTEEPDELPLDEVARPTERDAESGAIGTMCLYCGGALPAGRQVNFCPHCGQNQTTLRCPACQTEVEYGWHHCVNCGAPVGGR
ncbi:MAG TPA: zinc ribbon domain-containing protein [Gemmatimonadales bacterium]|nr:zinc ribbon domain-containing protein [Gemmatimonadales bacterium]